MAAPVRIEPARLAYASDGTPYSGTYDDIYHSTEGGLAQAQHVFLQGNQLPARWQGRTQFTILETGFGLGLSFLATWQAWRDDPQRAQRLHFISTELHPFTRADLQVLHAQWPALAPLASALQKQWPPLTPGFHHLLLDEGRVTLTLLFGNASDTLPQLVGTADAFFLDGFAPQKNPVLWSPALLAALSAHAAPGATLASWCVAGAVRTALAAAGWQVAKAAGFARKRHMLMGTYAGPHDGVCPGNNTATTRRTFSRPQARTAIVIGAGIAGCSVTEALARRHWQVTLIEQADAPAQAASGNPVGLIHPLLARDDNLAARFSRAASLYTQRLLSLLDDNGTAPRWWSTRGIAEIAADTDDAERLLDMLLHLGLSDEYVRALDHAEASRLLGQPVARGGILFPQGTWVAPAAFCHHLLAKAAGCLTRKFNTHVATLRHEAQQWHAYDSAGHCIATAEHLILSNAAAAQRLLPEIPLTLREIRGQLTYLPRTAGLALPTPLSGAGYAIDTGEGPLILGASFVEQDAATDLRTGEHHENLAKVAAVLPDLTLTVDMGELQGRVSFRAATHDRLPSIGTLPAAGLRPQHTLDDLPRVPGLHVLAGLGSRGLSWGPLGAEVLGAQLNQECLPIEKALLRALDPARYALRETRKAANQG